MQNHQPTDEQKRFDETYITSVDIMAMLKISRATLAYARKSNKLPAPIVLNDGRLFIWERDKIKPYLEAWETSLTFRRRGDNGTHK